ncbi:MAG: transporter substrate-binding domain-containing protein [Hahellaceae bacterium]|nr:transporter substrate-binding domain-containing protein [Hahellaceae bacterium]
MVITHHPAVRVLLCSLMCLPWNSTTASDTPARTALYIATDDWPPLIHQKFDVGSSPLLEIISESLTQSAFSPEFHFAPWSRAYANVRDGIWDASPGWSWNETRDQEVLYSDAVFPFYQVFFHLKSQPVEWETLEDLKTLRIGGTQDYNYGDDYQNAENSGEYKIERAQITHHSRPLTALRGSHVIFSKSPRGEESRNAFNQGLRALRETGRLDALLEKARPSQLRELGRRLTASLPPPMPQSTRGTGK